MAYRTMQYIIKTSRPIYLLHIFCKLLEMTAKQKRQASIKIHKENICKPTFTDRVHNFDRLMNRSTLW